MADGGPGIGHRGLVINLSRDDFGRSPIRSLADPVMDLVDRKPVIGVGRFQSAVHLYRFQRHDSNAGGRTFRSRVRRRRVSFGPAEDRQKL